MGSITFTGNSLDELVQEIRQFLRQVDASLSSQTPAQPVLTPVPAAQPAPMQQAPPVTPVPTAVPEYTHEQLGRAVAGWIDKSPDNRKKALELLSALGCQSVTQLDTPAKRAAYAIALRAQGVQI
jgi:hypothetical protein